MSDENRALVRKFYDAVNANDLDSLSRLIADDVVEHDEFPGLQQNKEGVIEFFKTMRAAFPDFSMSADAIIADGDLVAVRATMSGTHKGEFLGIPATGRKITVPFADFARVRNGQAVEHWGVTDTGVMMEQLTGE